MVYSCREYYCAIKQNRRDYEKPRKTIYPMTTAMYKERTTKKTKTQDYIILHKSYL